VKSGRFVTSGLQVDSAILDGEVIVSDETGRPQFYDLLRRARSPAYVAFDLLWLNGTDQQLLPLSERRKRLQGILPGGSAVMMPALAVQGRGRQLFELMRDHDLEGIVAKKLSDPYGPATKWLKIKNPEGRWELFNSRG
jgi:ATP-dependent DNA ligase